MRLWTRRFSSLMLNAMFQYGMAEDAYRLLFNEEFPGWLYEVNLVQFAFMDQAIFQVPHTD